MEILKQLILKYYNNEESAIDYDDAKKFDEFLMLFEQFMTKYKLPNSLLDLGLSPEIDFTIREFANSYTIKKDIEESFDKNNTSLTLSMFLAQNDPQEYNLIVKYYISNGEIVIDSIDFNYGSYEHYGQCKKIGTIND